VKLQLLTACLVAALGFGSLRDASAQTTCTIDAECADGDFCNGIERCVGGACVASDPIPCDDGDPCTRDACLPSAGCSHFDELCPTDCSGLPDGARCSDGTVCTVGDSCNGGVCVPGPAPACPDADECTSAACDPTLGCVYTEEVVSPPCVPNCSGTVADFTPCPGDGNLCSLDACLPSVDFFKDQCVVGLRLNRQCGDGNLCNGDEWCSPVLGCQVGPPLQCDDGDICNGTETCGPATGCQAGSALPDGTLCDDNLDCTTADQCAAGTCLGTQLTPQDCSDGSATTVDQCREGFGCLNCLTLGAAKLRLRMSGGKGGKGKIRARGILTTDAAAIAPASEDFVFIVDLAAAENYRVTLPALDQIAPGRFLFRASNSQGPAGLKSVRISQVRGDRFRWKVSATNLDLPGPAATAATITMLLGNDCFSATLPCKLKRNGNLLSCRP